MSCQTSGMNKQNKPPVERHNITSLHVLPMCSITNNNPRSPIEKTSGFIFFLFFLLMLNVRAIWTCAQAVAALVLSYSLTWQNNRAIGSVSVIPFHDIVTLQVLIQCLLYPLTSVSFPFFFDSLKVLHLLIELHSFFLLSSLSYIIYM